MTSSWRKCLRAVVRDILMTLLLKKCTGRDNAPYTPLKQSAPLESGKKLKNLTLQKHYH